MQNSVVSAQILAKIYRSWLKECNYLKIQQYSDQILLLYCKFIFWCTVSMSSGLRSYLTVRFPSNHTILPVGRHMHTLEVPVLIVEIEERRITIICHRNSFEHKILYISRWDHVVGRVNGLLLANKQKLSLLFTEQYSHRWIFRIKEPSHFISEIRYSVPLPQRPSYSLHKCSCHWFLHPLKDCMTLRIDNVIRRELDIVA